MSSRAATIYEHKSLFKLMITTSHRKLSKKVLHSLQGYLSREAAEEDIVRAYAHLDARKHMSTFQKQLGVASNERQAKRARVEKNKVYGVVAHQAKKKQAKKYRLYCKNMLKVELVPLSKEKWIDFQSL